MDTSLDQGIARARRISDAWWTPSDDLEPWLRWGAAIVTLVGIAFDMLAAYAYPWFNRNVLDLAHFSDSTWRAFTLHQLAIRIRNTGRYGDALSLLVVGAIVLGCAVVSVLVARRRLLARAGACFVMIVGDLLIGWGFELAKSPPPFLLGPVLWWTTGFGTGATDGGAACQAAFFLCAFGVLLAGVGWGRARWFRKTWLSVEGPLEPGRSGMVVVQPSLQPVGAHHPRTM